jgi:hypothetical protein
LPWALAGGGSRAWRRTPVLPRTPGPRGGRGVGGFCRRRRRPSFGGRQRRLAVGARRARRVSPRTGIRLERGRAASLARRDSHTSTGSGTLLRAGLAFVFAGCSHRRPQDIAARTRVSRCPHPAGPVFGLGGGLACPGVRPTRARARGHDFLVGRPNCGARGSRLARSWSSVWLATAAHQGLRERRRRCQPTRSVRMRRFPW